MHDNTFHIAVRVSSSNTYQAPYTAAGLGDRIHLITVAWAYANAHSCSVVLNISSNGISVEKKQSFLEILKLFPEGKIGLKFHDYIGINEIHWHEYLERKGITAKTFYYGDHLGRFEKKYGFDISPYLRNFPKLNNLDIPRPQLILPDRFITVQWDASGSTRTLNLDIQLQIMRRYQKIGYESISVGGKSTHFSSNYPLANAAYAVSKAELHVGVDSGFMHLAFLYLDYSKIHIYANPNGYWSHHLFRAYENGCIQNFMHDKPSYLQKIRIKAVYDTQIINKIFFSHPMLLNFIRRFGKSFRAKN